MSERYVSPHKLPEGRERELLVILAEECSEVIYHVSKALRFGLADSPPSGIYKRPTNAEQIAREIGDVEEVKRRLIALGTINADHVAAGQRSKSERLNKYLQTEAPS